jgi:hypothetical protein
VETKRKTGDIKLEAIYSGALKDLKRALKQSGYKGSERGVEALEANIIRDIKSDYEKYKDDIKEDIATSILARYLPESMIMERGLKNDKQVDEAAKLLSNQISFDKVLAKGTVDERIDGGDRVRVASAVPVESQEGASLRVKW